MDNQEKINIETIKNGLKKNINNELTNEDIKDLKNLDKNIIISLNQNLSNLKKLLELELDNKIVLAINNKEEFNKWIIKNSKFFNINNLYIQIYGDILHINNYLKYERRLLSMVEGIDDLTPFEKYVYLYNITKNFKNYNKSIHDKKDLDSSRNLYRILDNEYIVFRGFSNLFGDLLNKVGIENYDIALAVDLSYDKYLSNEEQLVVNKNVEKGYHARRYVHLIDKDYDIDGFYISDPTWDNDLNHDYYHHLAMTGEESKFSCRYLFFDMYTSIELLDVSSIQEFYEKFKFILNKIESNAYKCKKEDIENSNIDENLKKEKINKLQYEDFYTNAIKYLVLDLIDLLKKLDHKYIDRLNRKYPFLNNYNEWTNVDDLLYDIGNYITSHSNKAISGSKILKAIKQVYRHNNISENELDNILLKTVDENRKKQESKFPKRFIKKDIIKSELSLDNKFDTEFLPKKK